MATEQIFLNILNLSSGVKLTCALSKNKFKYYKIDFYFYFPTNQLRCGVRACFVSTCNDTLSPWRFSEVISSAIEVSCLVYLPIISLYQLCLNIALVRLMSAFLSSIYHYFFSPFSFCIIVFHLLTQLNKPDSYHG